MANSSRRHLPTISVTCRAASRGVGGREARLRGEVQPAGPLASGPSRRPRCRRRDPLALSILRRSAAEPADSKDHAGLPPSASRGDGRRRHPVLLGTISLAPVELALSQRIPFGTTAWRISMGRRQVVESVNSALKGAFVDLARGFFRVFGQAKMTVLLGFTSPPSTSTGSAASGPSKAAD